jgi:hypothetical protein
MMNTHQFQREWRDLLPALALFVAVVTSGACVALNYLDERELASHLGLLAACSWLYSGNLPVQDRHRQWWVMALNLLLCQAVLGLAYWVKLHSGRWLSQMSPFFSWIADALNIAAPTTIADAVLWLNYLLFALAALLKQLLRGSMLATRLYPGSKAGKARLTPQQGAYDFAPERGWQLMPKWSFARHFLVATTALLTLALATYWYFLVTLGELPGAPLLPVCAYISFAELAAYLGGKSQGQFGGSVGGESTQFSPFANYEAVWIAMRKLWAQHWLAAGNRDLWGKKS